jgi:hypothetical protein
VVQNKIMGTPFQIIEFDADFSRGFFSLQEQAQMVPNSESLLRASHAAHPPKLS